MVPFHVDYTVNIDELYFPLVTRLKRGLLGTPGGGTTDVEGTHGQLGAGLADGLGGNNPNRFAHVDQVPPGQVAAVTHGADTAPGLAGKNGTNFNLFQAGILDPLDQSFIDVHVGRNQDLPGNRVQDVVQGNPPKDAVTDVLDDFASFGEGGNQ